ncbi:hypothetical protein D3C78_1735810 [compost metagenome]
MINPKPVIAVAAAGLTPMLPVTEVTPVVDIPDFVNMEKSPAPPRFIAPGPIPTAGIAAKLAVIFLFEVMLIVNGLVEPVASTLQPVNE